MFYNVTSDKKPLNFSATGTEEILQNINMILSTPKGTVTLDRKFGLDMDPLDLPIEVAENIMTAQIVEALQDYEPRVSFVKATYQADHTTGKLKVKVRIKINDEYT